MIRQPLYLLINDDKYQPHIKIHALDLRYEAQTANSIVQAAHHCYELYRFVYFRETNHCKHYPYPYFPGFSNFTQKPGLGQVNPCMLLGYITIKGTKHYGRKKSISKNPAAQHS
jgi:hypothetical protein